MKKITQWLRAHAAFSLALSALAQFCGVYLLCPATGLSATLPVGFWCLLLAQAFRPGFVFPLICSAGLALLYGFGIDLSAPWVFAGEALLLSLLAALVARALSLAGKKKLWLIPAVVLFLAGFALPTLAAGTPGALLNARVRAGDYLSRRYPDQVFTRLQGYKELQPGAFSGEYRFTCEYDFEGNTLSSALTLFADGEIGDGYLTDRLARMAETYRSTLIEAFRDGEDGVIVEPDGLSQAVLYRETLSGVYGDYDPALEGELRFSVTFRREMAQKREFALAIRDAMTLLEDKGLTYHKLRFISLVSGTPVYECTVTPDTAQEEILDCIVRL